MKAINILKNHIHDLEKVVLVFDEYAMYKSRDKSKKVIQELTQVIAELEEKKISDLIESIKTTSEYSKYIQAKKDLKDVLKGGKDYPSCSFMDISIRDDRFEARKKELIECIGTFVFNQIEENGKIRARGEECE